MGYLKTAENRDSPCGPWGTGALLFALALVLRLLFWQATPDSTWPYSAWYKGDASTWMAWAEALQRSEKFEVDLPIRPPGAAYLIATLWNGQPSGVADLKILWCLLGAITVVLIYVAVRRSFGDGLALAVGLLCAASTGLMILSTSLNNEIPYLLLVGATLALWEPLCCRPRVSQVSLWAALHALACLVRAEHLLYFSLLMAYLTLTWLRQVDGREVEISGRLRRTLPPLFLAMAVFALVLAPWHSSAWSAIKRFNSKGMPSDPLAEGSQVRVEQLLRSIVWQPQALAALDKLPAATRRTSRLFVTATEGVRGHRLVTPRSLQILDDAFGYTPQPLPTHPYLALYGGLNFYLANNAKATGGFGRAPLERPPPLVGGAESYPLALIRGLPPAQLTLTYPPHLQALNHGYRQGWDWIRSHPRDALWLAGKKLSIFWQGAALGIGGHNLPLGLSGVRRQVDLVVPEGDAGTILWRCGLLILLVVGVSIGRGRSRLFPWTAFLGSKLVVTLAFFGYARQGASVIPVVALCSCLAVAGLTSWWELRRTFVAPWFARRRLPVVLTAVLLLLALETGRWAQGPQITIDGRAIRGGDPFPVDDHRDRRLEIQWW